MVEKLNKSEKIDPKEINEQYKVFKEELLKHFEIEEEEVMVNLSTLVDIEEITINFVYKDHKELKELLEEIFKENSNNAVLLTNFNNKLKEHMKQEEKTIYFMLEKFLTEERLKILDEKIKIYF